MSHNFGSDFKSYSTFSKKSGVPMFNGFNSNMKNQRKVYSFPANRLHYILYEKNNGISISYTVYTVHILYLSYMYIYHFIIQLN